ncbi:MAG: hypothetical protein JXX29_21250, partial [Deltaproteobacteria bacterium]|nr:hypothetical protein [Deltaproteobacteria bacterium]
MRTNMCLILLVTAFFAGCGGDCIRHSDCNTGYYCDAGSCELKSSNATTGTDVERDASDTDSSTDSETATDTDTGTETDTGTDTDTGTETDTGTDTDTGTETDTGTDTDTGTETDTG